MGDEAKARLAARGWFPSAGSVPYDVAASLLQEALEARAQIQRECFERAALEVVPAMAEYVRLMTAAKKEAGFSDASRYVAKSIRALTTPQPGTVASAEGEA